MFFFNRKVFTELESSYQALTSGCNSFCHDELKRAHIAEVKLDDEAFRKICIASASMPASLSNGHVHVTWDHAAATHWRGWFEFFNIPEKIYTIYCLDSLFGICPEPDFSLFERYVWEICFLSHEISIFE